MSKNHNDGRTTASNEKEPAESDSSHKGNYDYILVGGFIVMLCLIIVAVALIIVSSNNGAESTTDTNRGNSSLRTGNENAPCALTNGNTITCSNILNNTGEIVASYVNEIAEDWPADLNKLHIKNCIFPDNTLNKGWLPVLSTEAIISDLQITASEPTTIEEDAFNDDNFQHLTCLTLEDSIQHLKKRCLRGLHGLKTLQLNIDGDRIDSVAEGILQDVPNLLTLQIQTNIHKEHLHDLLWNTTLENLLELHINYNNLNELKSDTLRGLTNLVTLNAMSSRLTSVESTILASSASKIQKVNFAENELEALPVDIFNITQNRANFHIFLHNNKLKTLPEGIFSTAIDSSDTVQVSLEKNDWNCDCDLAWLRDYIANKIITGCGDPKCVSPPSNKGKLLIEADFSTCITTVTPTAPPNTPTTNVTEPTADTPTTTTDEPTADTESTVTEPTADTSTATTDESTADTEPTVTEPTADTPTTTANTTVPEGYIDTHCTCDTCNSTNIRVVTERVSAKSSSVTFHGPENIEIKEDYDNGDITVTIYVETEHVLIWKTNDNSKSTGCNYAYFNNKETNQTDTSTNSNARTYRSVKQTVEIETERNTSYLICAAGISDQEITISPQNCRAHRTHLSPEDRTWLANKQIAISLAIVSTALLVSVIVGGVIIYFVVRRNPRLIEGSNRVVVVNRRTDKVVLIMPEKYPEINPRRISEASTSASYITNIEPTVAELAAWNFTEKRDKLREDYETQNALVITPELVPFPLPRHTSKPSYDTSQNSEDTYVTVTDNTSIHLIAWILEQLYNKNESTS